MEIVSILHIHSMLHCLYLRARKFYSTCRAGKCSRSCGGGIQLLSRTCDNPLPKNGGRYCAGSHKMYESCNIQDCLMGTFDFREKQCNDMNNSTHSWTATYNVYSGDECKLICENERTKEVSILKRKVTKCIQLCWIIKLSKTNYTKNKVLFFLGD